MRVEDTWARLEERLRVGAPALHAALLPPADVQTPGLPPELAAWWRVFGGVDRTALGDESPLLPLYWHPLPAQAPADGRVAIAVDCHEEDELLFVDLGDGRVFCDEMPWWDGVGAMLEHVLRMFESSRDPVYRLFRYSDGHIRWE